MSRWAAHRDAAEEIAREAGRLLAQNATRSHTIERKGKSASIDLVTEMDVASEALIVERLRARFPDAGLLGEEGASTQGTDGTWIFDPLDGTTNYAHGHPQWCVTLAFEKDGVVRTGVIFDPLRDEMFGATEGEGATLNGRPIRVSRVATVDESMLATGFPYDRRERAAYYMAFYEAAVVATQGVRRAGAAALDMAWVACGRLDGYFEQGIKAWDVAAGERIVREAGGTVTGYDGGAHDLHGRRTAASNGLLHAELVALIQRVEARFR